MKLHILLSLTTLGLLAGCHAPLPQATAVASAALRARAADDLYPTVVGRHWQYDLVQQQDQSPATTASMTVSITSTSTPAPGVTEAVMDRIQGNFQPPSTRVRKTATDVVLSRLADPETGPSLTIMKLPLQVGQNWPGRPFGGGNTETVCPQGLETVTVPAGTYVAQRVDHHIHYAQGNEDVLSYWYAPNVGMVKLIENMTLWEGATAVHMHSEGGLHVMTDAPALKTSGSVAAAPGTPSAAWGFLTLPVVSPPAPTR